MVHPLRHFGCKKALIPLAVAFSVVYNIPKFFEYRYVPDAAVRVVMTDLRRDLDYVTYYIFWSKLVLVELIPYFTILLLNAAILAKIHKSKGFQKKFRATSRHHRSGRGQGGGGDGGSRKGRNSSQKAARVVTSVKV